MQFLEPERDARQQTPVLVCREAASPLWDDHLARVGRLAGASAPLFNAPTILLVSKPSERASLHIGLPSPL